ncbi:MAG: phospholipase D-like domain-containing protein [Candidatus Hydrothermia bacterium]
MKALIFTLLLVTPSISYDDSTAKVLTVFNTEYYPTLENLISSAQKEILICMFQFTFYEDKKESYSNKIVSLLLNKAEKGVKVRIILEGGENFLGRDFRASQREVANKLRHKNINVKFDKNNQTTHAKFVVIDDRWVLLGSTNWTYYGLQENNESNVLIESEKIARRFRRYFETLWEKSGVAGTSYLDREIGFYTGVVKSVEKKISKKGNPYTIIYLSSGTRVFIRGHYNVFPGQRIKIEGRITSFRGKEQIEAFRIELLK